MKSEMISFDDNGWFYTAKKVNTKMFTIEYITRTGFSSYEDAETQKKIDDQNFQNEIKRMKRLAGMEHTFSSYLDYWCQNVIKTYAGGVRQSVVSWAVYDLILPSMEYDIFLQRLTSSYLNNLIKRMEPICKSAGVITYSVLNCAFRDAEADGILRVNPMNGVKRPKENLPQMITYQKEHLKILLEAAYRYESVYLEILLALFLGLRTGEILGLRFSDFDFKEKTVEIRRQITQEFEVEYLEDGSRHVTRKEVQEKVPKSADSVRCLRVPDFLLEEVRKRQTEQNAKAIQDKKYSDKWLSYVCLGPHGTIKSYNTCRNALQKICTRNGIPKLSMHGLRHIFATLMLEQGVPLETLSKMLGHKNVATTLEIYCGVISGMDDIRTYVSNNLDPIQSCSPLKEVV